MVDVAFMGLLLAQMSSPQEMRQCFEMVPGANAAIMGLKDYGLQVGARASIVILDAGDPIEALRLRADRLCVIAGGKIISTRERNHARLSLPNRPDSVSRRHVVEYDA
jgi:cytosine deaminase